MQYNIFQDNPVISENNIQRWAHAIALSALKKVLSHSYNRKLNKLYMGLIKDIENLENQDWVFSDGYDLAQEAMCFLCEYMGKDINEVCATSVRGKSVSIKTACYSRINQMLMRERKEGFIYALNDSQEVINLSVPFKEETEEDWTNVDDIIKRMRLTEIQLQTLNCYLAGMYFEEIVRYFGTAECAICGRRYAIRKKYNKYIAEYGN